MKDEVILVHYQSDWILKYEAESTLLVSVLGDTLLNNYHIGSTSVTNLTSKPIIDILAEVHSLKQLDTLEDKFIDLGYEVKGENGIVNRRYFVKWKDGKRVIHLHCYEKGNPEINRHLKFKEILIADKKIFKEYEELKTNLVEKFKDNRMQYSDAKSEFIQKVLLQYE